MSKKVAIINDLSGFGHCSLGVALPILSVMKLQACAIPTMILSAQTGYHDHYRKDCTDVLPAYTKHWTSLGASFDGIYTGFVPKAEQMKQVLAFLAQFQKEETILLVDPVMGDNGRPYCIYTPALGDCMKELTKKATIITPNVTELCLLTDTDYQTLPAPNQQSFLPTIQEIAQKLAEKQQQDLVVTGILHRSATDTMRIGNLYIPCARSPFSSVGDSVFLDFPYYPESFSGTGDIFSSILFGGLLRGDSIKDAISLAGRFLSLSTKDAVSKELPHNAGVDFEQYLSLLFQD